jgi:hypothetical protein
MISIYVPDVGDGLAAGVRTVGNQRIQIDCGSQQSSSEAFEKGLCRINPSFFFLSHFHVDHYNGLFEWDRRTPWCCPRIEQAFFPRLPEFENRPRFLKCMLAMAHRVLGDTTGSQEADFLGILKKINFHRFTYRALSLGDTVQIGSSRFQVLWPPRIVDQEATLRPIKRAISDFDLALSEDERLRLIYKRVDESDEILPYLGAGDQIGEPSGLGDRLGRGEEGHSRHDRFFHSNRGDLMKSVKVANDSLRRAANHLSLAFREDNRLLFMGDLERPEIAQVVDHLSKEDSTRFLIMVTPHHGTHWHNNLGRLRCWWAVSSVGKELFGHVSSEFKSMSDTVLITHLNGDVVVPLYSPAWLKTTFLPHWSTFF